MDCGVEREHDGVAVPGRRLAGAELLQLPLPAVFLRLPPAVGPAQINDLVRWQQLDPLVRRADWVDRFKDQIMQEIDAAVAFAEAAPWPEESELLTDVI